MKKMCKELVYRWMAVSAAIMTAAVAGLTARGGTLVQEFYLPMPEQQIYQANSAVISGTGLTNFSTFSIVVTGNGTAIYYDQWEDGYEVNLASPAQATTKVWGDGNNANGIPPGMASDPVGLPAGTVITLTNNVPLPRNASVVLWDARDRVAATKALVISRAAWPVPTGPVFAGAAGVLSTLDYGTNYISPVGQDLTANLFKYVGMFVMAAQNNTALTIDPNGNGAGVTNVVLNQGESYLVNGGIKKGGRITASKPVQADLLVGHVGARYASDWFTLYPVEQWDNSYYTPVSSAASGSQPAYVYLYNPASNAITINYNTRAGGGSFAIPGTNGVYQFQMPIGSGASFTSAAGQKFFALCTVAANNSSDAAYNWGFTLVPQAALTTEATVGWGPGSDNGTVNGSPVWVTTTGATTVYVDYKGDKAGPLIDPEGNHYDTNFAVVNLQSLKIYDPGKDQTGMRVYTTDGTLLTAAWGEDADKASPGNPYIDAGTTVLPFPVPVLMKTAALTNDTAPPGLSIGDTIQYTVQVDNKGLLPLGNTIVIDAPSTNLTYVANSSTWNGSPIPDSGSGTAFPLDAPGFTIPLILSRGTSTFQYQFQVNAPGVISNSVNIGGTPITTTAALNPPPTNGVAVNVRFTDAGGSTVTLYSIGANVFATLTNAVGNTSSNSIQTLSVTVTDTNSADAETITLTETGNNTGVFRNTTGLPTSLTAGLVSQDGTLKISPGDTLSVSYTEPYYGSSSSATAAIQIPAQTKQLYLSVNNSTNGTQALNRVNPIAFNHSPTRSSVDLGGGGTFTTNAIGVDGSLAVSNNSGSTLSFNYTTGPGSNRLMLVTFGIQHNSGAAPSVSSVTYNGEALGLITSALKGSANPKYGVYLYALTNPPAGTYTLAITGSGGDSCAAGVVTFSNVNQTAVFNDTASTTSGSSVTLNSATNQLVFGSFYNNGSATLAAGQSAATRFYVNAAYDLMGNTVIGSNSATTSISWQETGYAVGAALNPATALVASGSGGTNVTSFAQTPVFSSAFIMPSNNLVTITNYITLTNGSLSANPDITATLSYGSTNFLTLTNPTYSSSSNTLVWSAVLPASVTVPSGAAIACTISNNVSGVAFRIDYDSANKPSKISLPASTVIAVDTFGIYDAPYPGGSIVTTPVAGTTLYVRANVSDPFGSYDITSLGLAFTAPDTNDNFSVVLNDSSVVATNAGSKTYEYVWTTGASAGSYTVAATANEGTEGVTAAASTGISTIFLDLGTPSTTEFISSGGSPTNSYLANSNVCVRVTDINRNTNATTVETIIATVSSTSGDSEILTLTETSTNSGIFTTCLTTSTNAAVIPNNSMLAAPVGSVLTASYTDPTDASDSTSATATIQPLPGVPGVLMNKTIVSPSGGQVGIGQPVTYNLQVVNVGSTTLPSLKITDTFTSSKLSFTSASVSPDTTTANTLTWNNLGAFTPGQSTNITVTFTTLATGTATNSATANGSTATNSSSVTLAVNSAAVNVVKTLLSPTNQPVSIQSNVVFRITVQNVGNTAINNLPMQDTFSGAYYEYVSATIPPSGSGFGTLIWTNLAASLLATNATITNDITMKVVGQGSPANNTATVDFATDIFGNEVPTTSSSVGVTTSSAGISGRVYNDPNQLGTFTNGMAGLANVTLELYTDPNADGNPADGALVQVTTTDGNGYYELLNLTMGNYVVVETDLAGYSSSFPVNNRLPLNLTNLVTFTNNFFFDYVPAPSVYSTFSGTVINDLLGTGTNTSQPGLVNVTIDVVQDVNSNNIADLGEPVVSSTVTDTNGNYSLAGITPGHYVLRESDNFGYYSSGDSQPPNDNQIALVTTNGVVVTNNFFFDRLSPVANADTNSTSYFAPVLISPLANDVSPNGDALTISNATSAFGIVVINPGATNLTFTPTNTGTATINYTIIDQHGGSASAVITVDVSAKALTITANSTSKTYGQTVTFAGTEFTVVGLTNGDSVSSVTLASAGAVNTAIVGSYAIIPSAAIGSGLANYAITYATNGTLTVNPALLGITANNTNRLYNTVNPTFTYTPSGFVNGDTASALSGAPSLTTTAILSSPIGTYPIAATNGTLSATNYVFSFTNGTLTVLGGVYGITWTNPASIVYGTPLGTNQNNATATVGGSYVYNPTNGVVLPAGTNTLSVVFTPSDTNYAATNLGVQLVVTPAPLTITADNQGKIYGAELNLGTSAFTSSGLVNSETIGSVTLTSAGTPTNAAAGAYAIVPSAATGGTFDSSNYSLIYSNGILTVSQATLTVTANSTNKVYGAAIPMFTYTASGFVNGDTAGVLSGSPSLTTAATTNSVVGSYAIVATNGTLNAANYSFAFTDGTLTVNAATLVVSANDTNRLYNTANPAFTASYSGFVNGETTSVLSGSPSLTTPAIISSPSGTYPIIATNGTLAATNYVFSFVNGTLTVVGSSYDVAWTNPASVIYGTPLGTNENDAMATVDGSYVYNPTNGTVLSAGTNLLSVVFTPTDTNYASTNVSVMLVVAPATLTVTANDTNRLYNTANPAFTYTASGFVNGEDDSVLSGSPDLTTLATVSSPIGDYPIMATNGTLAATNYVFSFVSGTLAVVGSGYDAVWTNPAGIVYGTPLGTNQNNVSATVGGSYVYNPTNGTVLPVGTNLLNVVFTPGDTNYASTNLSVQIVVTPAPLTITANSTSKTYGQTVAFAGTEFAAVGLTNGDSVTSVTLTSAGAANTAVVGSYAIIPSAAVGSGLANYAIAYATNGLLTVDPATLGIAVNDTNRLYNTANPAFTYTASGFVNGEDAAVLSGSPDLSTAATISSPEGVYPIVAASGTLSATNYVFSFTNGTLTVLGGSYDITWTNLADIVYGTMLGTNENNASATVAGSYVYNPTNGTVLPAGTNLLSVVFTPTDTNYAPTNLMAELVVLPATLAIVANDTNRLYNTANPAFSYTASGFVNGEDASVLNGEPGLATAATLSSPTGIYPIAAAVGTLSATNYVFSFTNGTLTVNPALPDLNWPTPTNIVYGSLLGTNQNNAASSVDGIYTYNPMNGVVLPAGTNTLWVVFTPGDTNYLLLGMTQQVVVLPAPLTISADDAARLYGQPNPVFGGTISGIQNGDDITATYATAATTNSPAGSYPVIPALSDPDGRLMNYTVATNNGTLTVGKAVLGITANNTNRVYGAENPVFTYTAAGFVNGENTGVLSGAPSLTTTATTNSPVGAYPIVAAAGTLSATNYVFSFTNGTLDVIYAGPQADVIVWLSGPASVIQGSNFVYQLIITNAGPDTSSNVMVSDSLPTNLLFVAASGGGKATNNIITWPKITALPAGGSTNYTLTVNAPGAGLFTNSASALAATLDPDPSNNSGVSPASRVQTLVAPPALSAIGGTPVLNPQTGLFEETVTVTNRGAVTVLGFRLFVGGLTNGVVLRNASGTNSGVPYVNYNFPLDPSNAATLILEFYNPTRRAFTHTMWVEAILPASTAQTSTNGSVAVTRVFTDTRNDGMRFVIEFNSVPGKTYAVIYSSDLLTWKVATPSIKAAANVTQWYDDGPPKTESKPGSVTSRNYRVIPFN